MAKKIKGKEWYELVAPRLFKNQILGESLVSDPREIKGRSVIRSLSDLGGHPSKYYVRMKFKVDEIDVENKKIKMKYVGQSCLKDFISQMIRKGSSRIDTVVKTKTKDNQDIVVKTIGISLRKINTSVKTALRKEIEEDILNKVNKMNLDDFIMSVIKDSFQVQIRKKLNKTYPIRKFEVRKIEII